MSTVGRLSHRPDCGQETDPVSLGSVEHHDKINLMAIVFLGLIAQCQLICYREIKKSSLNV
jgi:hypothetical protein